MQKKLLLFIVVFLWLIFLKSSIVFSLPINSYEPIFEIKAQNIGSNFIELNWGAPLGKWSYKIFKKSPNDTYFKIISQTQELFFKDYLLNSGDTYEYYVQAYNTSSACLNSNKIALKTSLSKEVLGFTAKYSASDNSSYNSLIKNYKYIDIIATYTYTADSQGNITGNTPSSEIDFSLKNNIKPYALITNDFNPDIAKSILENPAYRLKLIENICLKLQNNRYKGVNIDFEGLYYYNRNDLNIFMRELYNKLNPLGYKVTIDVPAKTWDNPYASWNGAYDYKELSRYSDKIIIMTYDEHYFGGSPGPIASIGWVQSVVKYSTSIIAPQKIMLGTAAYGYDWSSPGAKSYGIGGIYKLANQYNVQIKWDSNSMSPYFNYRDINNVYHSVWFENSTSLKYKLDIVNNNNLGGIAIWKLGLEDSAYFDTIKANLKP